MACSASPQKPPSIVIVVKDLEFSAVLKMHALRLKLAPKIFSHSLDVIPWIIMDRHQARLLLIDLDMPVLDGFDIASELKAIGSPVKVVILTSTLASPRALRAKAAGMAVQEMPQSTEDFDVLLTS